jgi:rod shape-determining protein MreB and related proteins
MDLNFIPSLNSRQLAVDLGTSNTLIYAPGEGMVVDEPSVIAVETVNGVDQVRAVGKDAKLLIGRTGDNIRTLRPLSAGVITDLEFGETLIRHFLGRALGERPLLSRGPELVIGIPSASTEVERRIIHAAAINAGAREVRLIEEPLAAAIGADLPVDQPIGSMIVDIGGGTTEVAIIALKRLTYTVSDRVGGDKMDEAIAAFLRTRHNMEVGLVTAERIKQEVASAAITEEGRLVVGHAGGRDVSTGALIEKEVSQAELAEALQDVVQQIVALVADALRHASPEIASDIVSHGFVLAGGGAMLRGMDVVLRDATGLPVRLADDPRHCTVIGAARALTQAEYRTELHTTAGAI